MSLSSGSYKYAVLDAFLIRVTDANRAALLEDPDDLSAIFNDGKFALVADFGDDILMRDYHLDTVHFVTPSELKELQGANPTILDDMFARRTGSKHGTKSLKIWWAGRDSNPQPDRYERVAF
jgi:hypothetical protein